MRIATSGWFSTQSTQMLDLQARIAKHQQQIASGKRLESAADDPVAAQRVDRFLRSSEDVAQAERNADTLQGRLETSSESLEAMTNLMVRLRELALSASNDTLAPSDRATIAIEVDEVRDAMLELANTRDADGAYVFAGASTQSPAFSTNAAGRIVWSGRGEVHEIPVGRQQSVRSGDAGNKVLASPDPADADASVFDLLATFSQLLAPPASGGQETEAERVARHEGIDKVLTRLSSSANRITDTLASQGARLARVDAERDRLQGLSFDWQAARAKLEGTDLTSAVVELERALTILGAVQASFGRVAALSLFEKL